MGCIIGNNKERIIDMNNKEIDYKSFRINNTQNDINKFESMVLDSVKF